LKSDSDLAPLPPPPKNKNPKRAKDVDSPFR